MRTHATLAFSLAISCLVSACAHPTSDVPKPAAAAMAMEKLEQQKLFLQRYFADTERLGRVGYRVEMAAVDFCGDKRRGSIGVGLIPPVGPGAAPALVSLFPGYVPETPFVASIVPNGPAARGGLKVGDIIVSIDGVSVTANTFANLMGKHTSGNPVDILISRGGQEETLEVTPTILCGYPFVLQFDGNVNAFADGKKVHVFSGLMNFIHTDDELAAILGHELTHNFRHHMEAKEENAIAAGVLGAILDGLALALKVDTQGTFTQAGLDIGGQAYSQDFEREADYIGLYVTARAGYDIDQAANVWRRMSIEYPNSITLATSHPTNPERFVALTMAAKEIHAKQAAHQPLVPKEKEAPKS